MQVIIDSKVDIFLANQFKKDAENISKVNIFLAELENVDNPLNLNNVEKIQRAKNYWRWTIAKYLILGKVLSDIATIKIIKIYKRKEAI